MYSIISSTKATGSSLNLPRILAVTPRRQKRSFSSSIPVREPQKPTNTRSLQTQVAPRPDPVFPCIDAHYARASRVERRPPPFLPAARHPPRAPSPHGPRIPEAPNTEPGSGPEPAYSYPTGYEIYHHTEPFPLCYSTIPLPGFQLAYETWGTLNADKSNAILLHTGLSASSHAASTAKNPAEGWWEQFIGPGKTIDTSKYFVICTNVLGGCYGSTGPSSPDPSSPAGEPYATRFPVLSLFDMVRAQFHLLDYLGIDTLYASVGSSMGAMQSLAAGWLEPDRVKRIVSISGTARSSPGSIAMRYAQRSVLMADPNWNRGFYYHGQFPHTGMKLARQIATITYRSGPEWELRFGRKLRDIPLSASTAEGNPILEGRTPTGSRVPALCPDFLIETYLDHQGEAFCLKYDANSLIYISKAMDLFDMTEEALAGLPIVSHRRAAAPAEEEHGRHRQPLSLAAPAAFLPSLAQGLTPLKHIPTLVLGIQSDILFPVEQQREVADALRMAGNHQVVFYELGGVWGHDTFLIDVANVGGAIRGFLH
ncbi:homoserine acetyltransferase [Dacryopinax primogenitus]|uniref:Homoserine acetyltransferase n=1 Tax=Dacryopinax primogenitus (strain DJM 731) TaxID=1858805 RepID=M5GFS7_DACPD|nr:homoserine acetyltransferase [Dacryopinax primogenitus]EJU06557.1 homoserine acetyltransferase [Dacryopinax primogenitus]